MRFRIVGAALWTTCLAAQPQTLKPPAFEVASVKRNTSEDFRGAGLRYLPGGRFTAQNMPLFLIIAEAYHLPFQSPRLSGGPDWIRSERYDLEATPDAGAIPAGAPTSVRIARTRLMLQALLADRFQLTVRDETREILAYVITVAKGGPKLPKAKLTESDCATSTDLSREYDACHSFHGGQGQGLHGEAVDLSDLTLAVENFSDRPVVDRTGLHGLYNIQTEGWVPLRPRPPRPPGTEPSAEDLAFADPARPTIFTIFDRLGLKLESRKAMVETFVIERVERPVGN
jgi:uncharacterized protein (TIGR03435 family)